MAKKLPYRREQSELVLFLILVEVLFKIPGLARQLLPLELFESSFYPRACIFHVSTAVPLQIIIPIFDREGVWNFNFALILLYVSIHMLAAKNMQKIFADLSTTVFCTCQSFILEQNQVNEVGGQVVAINFHQLRHESPTFFVEHFMNLLKKIVWEECF